MNCAKLKEININTSTTVFIITERKSIPVER